VPSLSLASENTNSGTQLSLVGTKKETTYLSVALDGTPAEGTADRDYGARLSYQPLLKPNAPNVSQAYPSTTFAEYCMLITNICAPSTYHRGQRLLHSIYSTNAEVGSDFTV